MSAIRLLAPRASLGLHSKQLQQRLLLPTLRYASTTPPPKPRVLEKPERFNPPSHPSRIRRKPKYYGPSLSEHERQEQKTKQYPHMMPPEGSFMRWFLTDRRVHVYITISILMALVVGIWFEDFIHNTPYRDLLPPNSMFFAHPITFLGRWAEVYNMHVQYTSQETAKRRRQKTDDAAKRAEYRKAHGLGPKSKGGFGLRLGKAEEETMSPLARDEVTQGVVVRQAPNIEGGDASYADFKGKPQPAQKKWLGIW